VPCGEIRRGVRGDENGRCDQNAEACMGHLGDGVLDAQVCVQMGYGGCVLCCGVDDIMCRGRGATSRLGEYQPSGRFVDGFAR
jgi:hypothetical protein